MVIIDRSLETSAKCLPSFKSWFLFTCMLAFRALSTPLHIIIILIESERGHGWVCFSPFQAHCYHLTPSLSSPGIWAGMMSSIYLVSTMMRPWSGWGCWLFDACWIGKQSQETWISIAVCNTWARVNTTDTCKTTETTASCHKALYRYPYVSPLPVLPPLTYARASS